MTFGGGGQRENFRPGDLMLAGDFPGAVIGCQLQHLIGRTQPVTCRKFAAFDLLQENTRTQGSRIFQCATSCRFSRKTVAVSSVCMPAMKEDRSHGWITRSTPPQLPVRPPNLKLRESAGQIKCWISSRQFGKESSLLNQSFGPSMDNPESVATAGQCVGHHYNRL